MKNDTMNLHDMHPADLADRLERLHSDAARELLQQLPLTEAAEVLAELDASEAVDLLANFTDQQIEARLRPLPPHRITDVLMALPSAREKGF